LNKQDKYLDFEQAKGYARNLKLKNQSEWEEFCKSESFPKSIPKYPSNIYKNKGWISIGDWLGTGRIADQYKEFKKFEDAKDFVRKLKLKGQREWFIYAKSGGEKPNDIPYKPDRTYKAEWQGWADFLGKEK
jgi:hypothetical protein